MGKMFYNMLVTCAEFEAYLIRMHTREAMALAHAKGKPRGKQPTLSAKQQKELGKKCMTPGNTRLAILLSCFLSLAQRPSARWLGRLCNMRRIDEASSFRLGLVACAMVFTLSSSVVMAEQSNNPRGQTVQESKSQATQVPPDVARYLSGAPPESQQFDFLIGDWTVAATRYKEDGSTLFQYKATWNAKYLNDRRMIIDDFKAYAPTGQAVSSYVTLRTYSATNHRWEMAGLAALQPAVNAEWFGEWKDGEMLMSAAGKDPAGNVVKTKIRFFHIAKDSFEWESQVSLDDGKTWSKNATLLASRSTQ